MKMPTAFIVAALLLGACTSGQDDSAVVMTPSLMKSTQDYYVACRKVYSHDYCMAQINAILGPKVTSAPVLTGSTCYDKTSKNTFTGKYSTSKTCI